MWDEIIRKRRNILSTLKIYTSEFCSSQGKSPGNLQTPTNLAPSLVCDSRGYPRVRFPHLKWTGQAWPCSPRTPADMHHNSSCRPRCWPRWRKFKMWAWCGWVLGSWRVPNSSCRRASPHAGLHFSTMNWRFLVPSTKAGLGQTEKESPLQAGSEMQPEDSRMMAEQPAVSVVHAQMLQVYPPSSRARERFASWAEGQQHTGGFSATARMLSAATRWWSAQRSGNRQISDKGFVVQPSIFKGLWTFFLWLSMFVGKQITVRLIFTFRVPSRTLTSLRTISSCWIHAPQFWASSKDPEGKHWRNLRWD